MTTNNQTTAESPTAGRLTIVLLSYNRLPLLRKAVESCLAQTETSFDLVIVDNGSSDGAADFIRELSHPVIRLRQILNPFNLGGPASALIGVEAAQTPWVTYLCDDDYLAPDFVASFYDIAERESVSCVAFSCVLVNEDGSVVTHSSNRTARLDPPQALSCIEKGLVQTAGISNFMFRKSAFHAQRLLPDYPNGWFFDTMLFCRAAIEKGIITSSKETYFRLIHGESASTYTNAKMFGFFEGLIRFRKDLESEVRVTGDGVMLASLRPIGLWSFFKSVIFPILTLGYLTYRSAWNYPRLAWRVNRKFLPHAFMVVLIVPLAGKCTLSLRQAANKLRKRFFCFRPHGV